MKLFNKCNQFENNYAHLAHYLIIKLNFSFELGVPEGKREDLFELFNRVHINPNIQGTGIALAHYKKIVELHQRKIWVESEVNKGSAFYFPLS